MYINNPVPGISKYTTQKLIQTKTNVMYSLYKYFSRALIEPATAEQLISKIDEPLANRCENLKSTETFIY